MSKLSETESERLTELDSDAAVTSSEFSLEQRRLLLRIAHEAILAAVEESRHGGQSGMQEKAGLVSTEDPASARLLEPRGVFATLYLDGELRGCVGYAAPVAPLYRAVAETACAAAFEDSRFLPVMKEEAARLEISLSVLSRLFPIDPRVVEVGRHGLVITQGARRGLLLPQVPVEYGWDRDTFLEQTCYKAGLAPDAWRNAMVEAFTAEVFSDSDAGVSS